MPAKHALFLGKSWCANFELYQKKKKCSPATLGLQNLKGTIRTCLKIWWFAFISIFTYSRKRGGSWFWTCKSHADITYDSASACSCMLKQVVHLQCGAFRGDWVHRSMRHILSCLPKTSFLASLLLNACALPLKEDRWGENSLCCIPLLH